jgi:hypothetical protein
MGIRVAFPARRLGNVWSGIPPWTCHGPKDRGRRNNHIIARRSASNRQFFDIFTEVSLDGGSTPTWLPMHGQARGRFTEISGSVGFFDTEMLSMNLTGDMAC